MSNQEADLITSMIRMGWSREPDRVSNPTMVIMRFSLFGQTVRKTIAGHELIESEGQYLDEVARHHTQEAIHLISQRVYEQIYG